MQQIIALQLQLQVDNLILQLQLLVGIFEQKLLQIIQIIQLLQAILLVKLEPMGQVLINII